MDGLQSPHMRLDCMARPSLAGADSAPIASSPAQGPSLDPVGGSRPLCSNTPPAAPVGLFDCAEDGGARMRGEKGEGRSEVGRLALSGTGALNSIVQYSGDGPAVACAVGVTSSCVVLHVALGGVHSRREHGVCYTEHRVQSTSCAGRRVPVVGQPYRRAQPRRNNRTAENTGHLCRLAHRREIKGARRGLRTGRSQEKCRC